MAMVSSWQRRCLFCIICLVIFSYALISHPWLQTMDIHQSLRVIYDQSNTHAFAHMNDSNDARAHHEKLSILLFGNKTSDLYNHFMLTEWNVMSFLPLDYNIFNDAIRSVYGDVSRLRYLLDKIINKKQCIHGLGFGGSVSTGRNIGHDSKIWTEELQYYLNEKYPCSIPKINKGKHYTAHTITNHAKSATSTAGHFWSFPQYITDVDSWLKYDCSNVDLIIFESSTNDGRPPEDKVAIYTELLIRQILQCKTPIALIYLHVARPQDSVFNRGQRYPFLPQGDYQHLAVLHYYKIPTVALTDIIYPLSYRYHLLLNATEAKKSDVTQRLYAMKQYTKLKAMNKDNFTYHQYDKDIRFSFDRFQKHLRCDHIHPCENAHKYYVALIGYLFIMEYKNMMLDDGVMFEPVYHDVMLPPFLYNKEIGQDPLFYHLATRHVVKSSELRFNPDANMRPNKIIPKDLKSKQFTHVVGPFRLINETAQQRLVIEIKDYFDTFYFGSKPGVRCRSWNPSGYCGHYTFNDLGLQIKPRNNSWRLIVERHRKMGLIAYEIGANIMFKLLLYHSRYVELIANKASLSNIFCIVSYLTSYENIGVAQIWVTDSNGQNVSAIHTLDGLVQLKESVLKEYIFAIKPQPNQYEYYFHAQVIDTLPTRKLNKFKLLSINTFAM